MAFFSSISSHFCADLCHWCTRVATNGCHVHMCSVVLGRVSLVRWAPCLSRGGWPSHPRRRSLLL
jgi:hypothetical protein